jgi:uncharacterized protein (TIGR03437 family)
VISVLISNSLRILLFCALCAGVVRAQTLTMLSGNGQLVATQSRSSNPLVVQAKDPFGHPAPNVAVTWAIPQGAGTIVGASSTTDANGQASAGFLATTLQPDASYLNTTVTASSTYGTVGFAITTVVATALQPSVSIELDSPPLDNPNLTGPSGSTIPAGVVVRVFATAGVFSGTPIPNVGVQLISAGDPSTPPAAFCAGPTGTVLTNNVGTATCDLVVSGPPGTVQLRASVGSVQSTRGFGLTITPGQSCAYSLSALNQSFSANGGAGTVNIITTSGCGWSAISNANFIAITSPATGIGSGSVSYSVAPNNGAGRAATLVVAGQTYTVNQTGVGSGSLTIPAQTLPVGALGTSYHTTLIANGGTPPYTWSPAGPISTSGLALQPTGDIDGAPSAIGTFSFVATVADSAGAGQAQNFSITINVSSPPSSGFAITNTSFPDGAVGQAYPPQSLNAPGGCVTPFSPQPGFTVTSGNLPDGLSIQSNSDGTHSIAGTPYNPGQFSFTLTATDACGKTATDDFSITITGTPLAPQMLVSPVSLAFTVQYGASNAPADQTLTISSNGASLNYAAAVVNPPGGVWLIAKSAANGNTPGAFTVGVSDFSNLVPGDYTGSVTIASSASNSPVAVPVKLTVLPASSLTADPSAFTIDQTVGSSTIARQDIRLASGTTSLPFITVSTTNKGGQWLAVSTNQGNTPTTLTAIINSTGLGVGQYTGTITIIPASGLAQTIAVTLNILSSATLSATPTLLAFNYQVGGNLPPPQTLTVNGSGTLLNVSASTATQNGGPWLSASPSNGVTNLNLSVSASPTGLPPGTYAGTINITASDPSVPTLTIAATLTVTDPGVVIATVTNAASYAQGAVAPGEIVTIFGSGIGPSTLVKMHISDSGTVDTNLGGTQVFFDGYPAPLIYSSATQVSAIIPYEVAGSLTTSMLIQYQGSSSNRLTVPVLGSLPGIFTMGALGSGQGAIVNKDNTINSSQNGADPGSIVSIYATGGGQTNPPNIDGSLPADARPTELPVKVQIAGETADVIYAGAAPGEPAGMLQVNARIPADVARGTSVSLVITVGNTASQSGVTLAIKP